MVAADGCAFTGEPGIFDAACVAGWRLVTDAVHAAGGRIQLQIWHPGRSAHSSLNGGVQPISSGERAIQGLINTPGGKQPYEVPRRLRDDELPAIVELFRQATRRALQAGFDGVQLHGAHGYLLDQFLRDGVNDRSGPGFERYGGSIRQPRAPAAGMCGRRHRRSRRRPCGPAPVAAGGQQRPARQRPRSLAGPCGAAAQPAPHRLPGTAPHGPGAGRPSAASPPWRASISRARCCATAASRQPRRRRRWTKAAPTPSSSAVPTSPTPTSWSGCAWAPALNEPEPKTYYGAGATGYTDYPCLADGPASPVHTSQHAASLQA